MRNPRHVANALLRRAIVALGEVPRDMASPWHWPAGAARHVEFVLEILADGGKAFMEFELINPVSPWQYAMGAKVRYRSPHTEEWQPHPYRVVKQMLAREEWQGMPCETYGIELWLLALEREPTFIGPQRRWMVIRAHCPVRVENLAPWNESTEENTRD